MKHSIWAYSLASILLLALLATSRPCQKKTESMVPKICFEHTMHSFGTIEQGSPACCNFTFTNCGTGTLIIDHVSTTCGCTCATSDKKKYLPGEKGTIQVEYNSNKIGNIGKLIFVVSNANGYEKSILKITGKVESRNKILNSKTRNAR